MTDSLFFQITESLILYNTSSAYQQLTQCFFFRWMTFTMLSLYFVQNTTHRSLIFILSFRFHYQMSFHIFVSLPRSRKRMAGTRFSIEQTAGIKRRFPQRCWRAFHFAIEDFPIYFDLEPSSCDSWEFLSKGDHPFRYLDAVRLVFLQADFFLIGIVR